MIRVVFTASNAWLSRLIRWLSGGRVSHCLIQHPSQVWGGDWVTEATWPMVLQRPAEKGRHHIHSEFICRFDAPPALQKIRREVGKWYAFEGFFLIGWWLLIKKIFKTRIRHPLHSTKGDICSELLVKFFQAAQLPDANKLDPDYTTPEKVLRYCENHPEQFQRL
jgi:hypothetical protein